MAGAYRMALSRAKATITTPDGGEQVEKNVTATVRDGKARLKRGNVVVAEMDATELDRRNGRHYLVTGADGTVWDVLRDCGCGGSR